jgi:DNA-binding NarL/FixJ family response regulator
MRDYKQPFARIGGFLDKNHSTIVHYMDNIDHELKTNVEFRERLKRVGKRFKSVMAHNDHNFVKPVSREEVNKYMEHADQNKALKQTIRKLKKREEELLDSLDKAVRKDSRIKDLCDMLEQRVPQGKEDEAYKYIYRMMNGFGRKNYNCS